MRTLPGNPTTRIVTPRRRCRLQRGSHGTVRRSASRPSDEHPDERETRWRRKRRPRADRHRRPQLVDRTPDATWYRLTARRSRSRNAVLRVAAEFVRRVLCRPERCGGDSAGSRPSDRSVHNGLRASSVSPSWPTMPRTVSAAAGAGPGMSLGLSSNSRIWRTMPIGSRRVAARKYKKRPRRRRRRPSLDSEVSTGSGSGIGSSGASRSKSRNWSEQLHAAFAVGDG